MIEDKFDLKNMIKQDPDGDCVAEMQCKNCNAEFVVDTSLMQPKNCHHDLGKSTTVVCPVCKTEATTYKTDGEREKLCNIVRTLSSIVDKAIAEDPLLFDIRKLDPSTPGGPTMDMTCHGCGQEFHASAFNNQNANYDPIKVELVIRCPKCGKADVLNMGLLKKRLVTIMLIQDLRNAEQRLAELEKQRANSAENSTATAVH